VLVLSSDVIYTIINIVILVALLRIFLWKPVLGIIEKRQKAIQDDLDSAAKTNQEAQAVKAEYEASLTGARQESAALVSEARDRAGEQADAILAQANADAEAIREKARADAQSEKERVLSEAKGEVADLALLAAAKLLGSVDEETDRRLLDDWLAEMGGNP
jgi:F-type H+-transporting ATPase subunit b